MELGRPIQEEDWDQIFINTYKFSISCDTQEHSFKLLSRWYRSPVNLNQIFPSQSDLGWRCNAAIGNLSYLWWACPSVYKLWDQVICLYNTVADESICNSVDLALFSFLP